MTPYRYSRIIALRQDPAATAQQLRDALDELLTERAILLDERKEPEYREIRVQPKRRRRA